jgi:N-acyl-D-amino-acid deacylase
VVKDHAVAVEYEAMTTSAPTHDLVIRNGLIVDGTGAPARRGDVAVQGDRLAAVGAVSGRARREIEADGLVIAPGFIDPHTHYDAQLTWDPFASCSSWHGVTTVVMGNCGFTLAPCREADRLTLMRMLTYVEGMPLEALTRGVRWGWETFGQYLEGVDRLGPWTNVGCFIGHSAVRQYVMGDAAWEREATGDEIARMGALVTDAMALGAVGLSSTANKNHVGARGRPVPSRLAHEDELTRLVRTMGASGRGILELTIGGTRPDRLAEVDRFAELARAAGRPVTLVSLRHNPSHPEEHRAILARIEALGREGVEIYPQVTTSPLTATFDLASAFVFFRFPVWQRVLDAPVGQWRALFRDAAFRSQFRDSVGRTPLYQGDTAPLRVHTVGADRFKALVGLPVSEVAARRGQDVIDAFFDLALEDDLQTQFTVAIMNTDAASVAEIFTHPRALIGLSDAGAGG